MGRLDGRVAVVTGAGMGQGRSTALRLAHEGANVVATDISGAEKDTASEMPDFITSFGADVTNSAQVAALMQNTVDTYGRLDILCNVVGLSVGIAQGPVPDIDEGQFDNLLDINLKSVYLGMKYGIPAMVASGGGSIINWSSVAALTSRPGGATYGATKAGILALTRTAALEWGKENTGKRHLSRSDLSHRDDPRRRGLRPRRHEVGCGQGRAPTDGSSRRDRVRRRLPRLRRVVVHDGDLPRGRRRLDGRGVADAMTRSAEGHGLEMWATGGGYPGTVEEIAAASKERGSTASVSATPSASTQILLSDWDRRPALLIGSNWESA